ncbi:MAG: ATP-grasp domain-containing protein [Candidatus Omnitrophota bacterium]
MKNLKILVLFDSAGTPPDDQNFEEEFKREEWLTEAFVIETLKKDGHEVKPLGIYDDITLFIKAKGEFEPDVVFNLTEIFNGKASQDKNIPSLCELLQVPYTGCSPVGLMICNNKALTKKILTYHRIKVPKFQIFRKNQKIWMPRRLKFPIIVKPLQEEASVGIAQASFVENEKDFAERIEYIYDKFDMPALAEEYIEGRELYASVLGNKKLDFFPLRELLFEEVPDDAPKLATYKAKWDHEYRKKWGIKNEYALRLPSDLPKKIQNICKIAYKALQLDGYARFDLRVTPQNEIYIIEANANPALTINDELAESAKKTNVTYDKLLQKIINLGLQRG